MSRVRVLHIPTADLARGLNKPPAVTVEAEYGDFVLEGWSYTAAHHQRTGPYAGRHLPGRAASGRPSPCNDEAIPVVSAGDIAISHIDLDTIGGVLRALGGWGRLFALREFWALAEFVDVTGPHRLPVDHPYRREIHAVWAWLQNNRPQLARDQVMDVKAFMVCAGWALDGILLDRQPDLIRAGDALAAETEALNSSSLLGGIEDVLIRKSDRFVNHLYRYDEPGFEGPTNSIARAVVALNTTMGSITVSFESPIAGVSAREIVQRLWGPDAGGHDGIAGSPRGRVMTEDDLHLAASEVASALGYGRSA